MQTAVDWMVRTEQKADGGYSNFGGEESDIASTLDAILALAAANADLTAPLAYLQTNADDLIAYAGFGGGAAGKIILSLVAAGESPREFVNFNFVTSLTGHLGDDGRYNVEVPFDQALALLALASVREPIPPEAVQWLKEQQGPDGAWSDGYGTDSNADATGAAIMALVPAAKRRTATT
jgi:prenyltransferase beta subunit